MQNPGEIAHLWFENGSILSHPKEFSQLVGDYFSSIYTSLTPGQPTPSILDGNLAENPVSAVGSYGMSVRINPSGNSATVAIYNSLSFSSGMDNLFGNEVDDMKQTTYQTYIWIVPYPY